MKTKKAIVIIFFILLLAPTLTWPLGKLFLNPEIDENRQAVAFPAMGDNFISEYELYLLDNAPYRNINIKANSSVSKFFENIFYSVLNKLNIPYYQTKQDVLFGKENWLFYTNDDSLKDYQGTNLPTAEELLSYLDKVTKVNNYFKSIGKEFVIFIPPNKEQVYSEYLPNGLIVQSEAKRVDTITKFISQNSDVKIIYALDDIKEAKGEDLLYFKNDTHWNTMGAAYGTKALLEELEIDVGDMTFNKIPSNFKDLANMALVDAEAE